MRDVDVLSSQPLFVDLEDGLVPTDLLWEATLRLVTERPFATFMLLVWAVRGRQFVRDRLAEQVCLDAAELPYRPEVLSALEEQKRLGRRLVLRSSDGWLAAEVAKHLGLFDVVVDEQAGGGVSRGVGPSPEPGPSCQGVPLARFEARGGVRLRLDPAENLRRPHASTSAWARDLLRALRPHQWAKNLLLLVPLIMSHRMLDPSKLVLMMIALAAFSLTASFVYVTNDLLDLRSDRNHRTKRHRPFASSRVPIVHGLVLALLLLGASAGLSAAVSVQFLSLVLLYIAACLLYSVRVKRVLMLDVIFLAGFYTLRLFAGGLVMGIKLSNWLIAFSMFLFLSLAFAKRYVELSSASEKRTGKLPGRGYGPNDLDMIRTVGPTSGYLAVLVICLYIEESSSVSLYHHPELLWLLCPVLLYWITRVWFVAQRGELSEDPVLFAIRDRPSILAGFFSLVIVLTARLWVL